MSVKKFTKRHENDILKKREEVNVIRGPKYYHEKTFSKYYDKLLKLGAVSVSYHKFENINSLGEECTDIIYICSGVAALGIQDVNGNSNFLCFFGAGSMYPAYSAPNIHYLIEKDACFVRAMTEIKALKVSQKLFADLMHKEQELPFLMLEYFSDMLEMFCFEISNKSHNTVFTNTCIFLWVYHKYLKKNGVFMTQEEMAEAVGCTRVALASVLKKLKEKNAISIKRKQIEVIDEEKILNMCQREMLDT